MNQLNGNEEFTLGGKNSGITVNEFWSWAYSDLLNNTYRGVLAEFLVEKSLAQNTPPRTQMRVDWAPYDLISPTGRRIEVKSAAYLQSWEQDYYSKIIFDIAPHRAWDAKTGFAPEAKRNSDLYVFCIYTALSRDESMLNLDLWDFYVLPTSVLNERVPVQKTIGLQSLQKLCPIKANYSELGGIIETIQL